MDFESLDKQDQKTSTAASVLCFASTCRDMARKKSKRRDLIIFLGSLQRFFLPDCDRRMGLVVGLTAFPLEWPLDRRYFILHVTTWDNYLK